MANCENCKGCGGCGASLELTAGELALLQALNQYAFLPVARRADSELPVYLEEEDYTPEEYSTILQLLERKRLISIDYDQPLQSYGEAYAPYPVRGSMALTERGQAVTEQLDLWGIQ